MTEKQLNFVLKAYEEELRKRMEPEEFHEFMTRTAKELFRIEIEELPESDIKDFCKEQLSSLTLSQRNLTANWMLCVFSGEDHGK